MARRLLRFLEKAISLEWVPSGRISRGISVILGLGGATLSIVIYVGILKDNLNGQVIMQLGTKSIVLGLVAALAANTLLYLAWKALADGLPLTLPSSFALYSQSAIARYIPTGIGHFLARQLSADRWGLEKKPLFRVSAWELAIALLVSGVLALPVFLRVSNSIYLVIVTAVLLLALFCTLWMSTHSSRLVISALSFLSYFIIASFAIDVFRGDNGQVSDSAGIIVAYSAAWLISTLVPFFPGGVGLREISFIGIISVEAAGAGYESAVVLLRIGLWLGELLFAAVSIWALPRFNEKGNR